MDPAYSIIVFTTASGAGYGLLALVSLLAIGGALPPTTGLGLAAIGAAAALIVAGLSSSALHLGRPERALGAFSQWRSSWLAREGVAAVATFAPLGLFGIGWVFFNDVGGFFAWMAAACALLALLTVSCTAMIYASLKPIRQWRNGFVLPGYLALGLYSGSLLLVLLTRMFGVYRPAFALLAVILLGVAWAIKWGYWRHIDATPAQISLGAASGLGRLGEVRLLEAPHTEANFVMREMGYAIARAHARKLRIVAHVALFFAPLALLGVVAAGPPIPAQLAALLAVLSAALGVGVERWLFFAEARHVSMLFYDRAE
ncbi:MAG: DmsC/YnfH family molybdoenzyme membrane anchor subunit [Roseiarcus sp.]|jgi:DMSO reductase anchor subunit